MCDKVVEDDSSFLQFVPDWFITKEWIDMWYDDYYDDDGHHWDVDGEYWDDKDIFFEWYDGCKKRKVQKAQIKKELLPIVWHPPRYWDWDMSGDEKKEMEKL